MANKIRFVLLIALISVVLLPMSPVTAQGGSYQVGANLYISTANNTGVGSNVTINAVKTIRSDRRSAIFTLTLGCYGSYPTPRRHQIGPVTLEVPIDADNLSVSRDLGWAGLDADVTAVDVEQVSQTSTTVPVGIHISWLATADVVEGDGQFQREASFAGAITSTYCNFPSINTFYRSRGRGYIFSLQAPKKR